MVAFVSDFVSNEFAQWFGDKDKRESVAPPIVTVEHVADHVEHIREVAGIDHVGIGADFDGATDMPIGLDDVSTYPLLMDALSSRGWSLPELEQLRSGNILRVLRDAEVDRNGKIYWMSFKRGVAGIFEGDGPKATFTPASGLRTIGKVSAKVTGTRIKWWNDRQIFLKDAELDIEEIYARARQTSYLVPGLTLIVNDNRTKTKTTETFYHKGGISEYCEFMQPDQGIGEVIRLTGSGHYQETVPVLDDQGHMVSTEVERDMSVDINFLAITSKGLINCVIDNFPETVHQAT